jgi:hypothetical protein
MAGHFETMPYQNQVDNVERLRYSIKVRQDTNGVALISPPLPTTNKPLHYNTSTMLVPTNASYRDLLLSYKAKTCNPISNTAYVYAFKRLTGLSISATVTPELFNSHIKLMMAEKITQGFATFLTGYDFKNSFPSF